jgi:hypothetical protein
MNKDNNNNNKMNFLSVRGGANHNRGALSAVMVEALSIVNNFYQTSPYVAAALTCVQRRAPQIMSPKNEHPHPATLMPREPLPF